MEGVFAHGKIYVLISRVTDPQNFYAVGLPPADLLDAVAEAVPRNSHMKLFGFKTLKIKFAILGSGYLSENIVESMAKPQAEF